MVPLPPTSGTSFGCDVPQRAPLCVVPSVENPPKLSSDRVAAAAASMDIAKGHCSQNFLKMDELTVNRIRLNAPSLTQIADALLLEMSKNYSHVNAEVVLCPDLTQPPFNLTSEGLSGDENILDIGDTENVFPSMKREKLYNVKDLKKITMSDPMFVIGPSCGPLPFVGADNECMVNMRLVGDRVVNGTYVVTSTQTSPDCTCLILPDDETRFSLLANFFTSNGYRGKVLKIVCEVRTGSLDFLACIRHALSMHFGDQIVALGGVILMENGKVKIHIVKPDLMKTPLKSYEEMNKWLHWVEATPPIWGAGCIVSHDPGMNLRLQHAHLISDHGVGGHYHIDVEPKTIKYTAYLNVAKYLTKIDQSDERLDWGDMPN